MDIFVSIEADDVDPATLDQHELETHYNPINGKAILGGTGFIVRLPD